jgi:hypothetical protein
MLLKEMAVVMRNVGGINWGIFSREEKRMHLQVTGPTKEHLRLNWKVWLENKGSRIFEPDEDDIPSKVLKSLREALIKDSRAKIEIKWTDMMTGNHWLDTEVDKDSGNVYLIAYPNTHHQFRRLITNTSKVIPEQRYLFEDKSNHWFNQEEATVCFGRGRWMRDYLLYDYLWIGDF